MLTLSFITCVTLSETFNSLASWGLGFFICEMGSNRTENSLKESTDLSKRVKQLHRSRGSGLSSDGADYREGAHISFTLFLEDTCQKVLVILSRGWSLGRSPKVLKAFTVFPASAFEPWLHKRPSSNGSKVGAVSGMALTELNAQRAIRKIPNGEDSPGGKLR